LAQRKTKPNQGEYEKNITFLRWVLWGFNCVRQQSSRGRMPGGAEGKLFSVWRMWTSLDFSSIEPWLVTQPWDHGQDLAPGSGTLLKKDFGKFWKITKCL